MNKIVRGYLKYKNDKKALVIRIFKAWFGDWLPDGMYLKVLYWLYIGKRLDLKNPKTYNEKLQWLKIHDRNPLYTTLVDKYAVKEYVGNIIGYEHIIPTIKVWDRLEDIDFTDLPDQFVLKTTFGGGGRDLIICKDKNGLEREAAINYLKFFFLEQDAYRTLREWPYKNVPRKLIVEKYMEEPGRESLIDYKVMCFNGVAKLIEYHEGRYTERHTQDFYDRAWNKTDISQGEYGELSEEVAKRPVLLDEMLRLSEMLAKDIPHVRVDWYIVNSKLYFGEMTFFDGSGLVPWDKDYDLLLGSWIDLSGVK